MGHEGCGIVESVGLGVNTVKAGDKVVMLGDQVMELNHRFPLTFLMERESQVEK